MVPNLSSICMNLWNPIVVPKWKTWCNDWAIFSTWVNIIIGIFKSGILNGNLSQRIQKRFNPTMMALGGGFAPSLLLWRARW